MAKAAAETTILRRMASAGRGDTGPSPAARVFGASIAKAAEAVLHLPVSVAQVLDETVALAELGERLEERALLVLVEAPQERFGLVALAPGLVATVVEMLTTGQMAAKAPPPRRPTRTDAALCAGIIDRVLVETDAGAAEAAPPWDEWQAGFRYASCVEDARLLPLLLDDTRYRLFHVSLALGAEGARQAVLSIVLPEPVKARAGDPAVEAAAAAEWQGRLAEALLETEATITAILARLMRPLAEVLALEPGALLMLPDDAIARVRLEGAGRRLLTEARLGQYRGYLAVRLTQIPDPQALRAPPRENGGGEDFDLPLDVQPREAQQAAAG